MAEPKSQFRLTDDSPRRVDETFDDRGLMVGQEERRSIHFPLAALQTPFERAELHHRRLTATQQRADPSLELGELERLGHVVVGSGVEPLHAILGAVSRGEDQHRRRRKRSSTVKPSSCGRPRSSTTRSNCSAASNVSAWSPSPATTAWCPAPPRASRSPRCNVTSSSTRSTRIAASPSASVQVDSIRCFFFRIFTLVLCLSKSARCGAFEFPHCRLLSWRACFCRTWPTPTAGGR